MRLHPLQLFAEGAVTTTAALWRVFVPGLLVNQNPTETLMQKYSIRHDSDEHRVVRKWRLRVLAFYGSIVAVLLLLSAISDKSAQVAGEPGRSNAGAITASR